MRFSRVPRLAAAASLALAAPALAQEDGVFIDPDSPSAKEYSIPLERERRQADPGQSPSAEIQQGSRSSPIFGAGIVRGGQSAKASTATPGAASEDPDRDPQAAPDTAEPQSADDDDEVIRAATSNPGAPSGGAGVPLTIGGVAVGVLIASGLAGLLLRRRRV